MSHQIYALVSSWSEEEFPFPVEDGNIRSLNEITSGAHYAITINADGEKRVEQYQFKGEEDEVPDASE